MFAACCIVITIQSANSNAVTHSFGETVYFSEAGRLIFIMIPVAVGSPGLALLFNILDGIVLRGAVYSKLGHELAPFLKKEEEHHQHVQQNNGGPSDTNELADMLVISAISWGAWGNAVIAIIIVRALLPIEMFWSDVFLHTTAMIGFVLPVALMVLGVLGMRIARSSVVRCASRRFASTASGTITNKTTAMVNTTAISSAITINSHKGSGNNRLSGPLPASSVSTRRCVFFAAGQLFFFVAWHLSKTIHAPESIRWALLGTHVARLYKVSMPYVRSLEWFYGDGEYYDDGDDFEGDDVGDDDLDDSSSLLTSACGVCTTGDVDVVDDVEIGVR